MRTLQEMADYGFQCLDGRDKTRLAEFIPFQMLKSFDLTLKEGITEEEWDADLTEFTRENILKQLESDVAFGFEKAINERGISSSLMFNVVQMWNYILDEGLAGFNNYGLYGVPLFKVTAEKYGFNDPTKL